MLKTRKRTNPVFYREAFAAVAGSERAAKAAENPESIDLLVWNVFSSLETHSDPAWLAGRLQNLAGPGMREPVRIALWTGSEREPLLHPPASYVAHVRERARAAGADDESVAEFASPVSVPARIESPDAVALVDAMGDELSAGHGGRDRVIELIDVALEQARRLGKAPAVAVIYKSGTPAAGEVSARLNALRRPGALATHLSHRSTVGPVVLREMSWQQLLRIWQAEASYLDLDGHQIKAFAAHCRERGLL